MHESSIIFLESDLSIINSLEKKLSPIFPAKRPYILIPRAPNKSNETQNTEQKKKASSSKKIIIRHYFLSKKSKDI